MEDINELHSFLQVHCRHRQCFWLCDTRAICLLWSWWVVLGLFYQHEDRLSIIMVQYLPSFHCPSMYFSTLQ